MVRCEHCEGRGWVDGFVSSGRLETLLCLRCEGKGEVSVLVAGRMAEGRRRRDDRLARGLSVRQEAERLGITAVRLGEIERGL
jgi:hypothetical protein